jgi:hypothetical protein
MSLTQVLAQNQSGKVAHRPGEVCPSSCAQEVPTVRGDWPDSREHQTSDEPQVLVRLVLIPEGKYRRGRKRNLIF